MQSFYRWNNIAGWICFAIAAIVYGLTIEPTSSWWDCGEFISAANGLQVVHPPGAPLFLMLGRFFALFAGDNLQQVSVMVNMMSAIMSALTVLFTFWIATYYASRIIKPENNFGLISVIGAGLVAALTLTFIDTFWFSAVEAEVYASSSFFTMITFWCILKWERVADEAGSSRWLILIAYLIGLAIGVHLLNLLVIPAIVYVVYFRKYKFSIGGFLLANLIGLGILGFVQVGIIPGIPTLAAKFDLTFVNDFGLPFGSGAIFLLSSIFALVAFFIFYTSRKGKIIWNTILLAFAFCCIGYSSYIMVVVRSLAEPPIDMNNPEQPFSLVSYLNREQYGDRPLLYGPYFNAEISSYEEGKQRYRKGEEKYLPAGKDFEYVYNKKYMTFFPRMGDNQKGSSPYGYKIWANADEKKVPTMSQNLKFFVSYQLNHMYFRYFFWNFVGRQNDIQGHGNAVDGNWLSGITFIDELFHGPQNNIPETRKNNPARNTYYFLPLILGILGMYFQATRDKNNFLVILNLFLFTGLLIAVYLNAPPFEPRERDYTLVGSFQIFCIWVGLGTLFLAQLLSKKMGTSGAAIAVSVSLVASPALLAAQNWDDHDRSGRYMVIEAAKAYLNSCEPNALLFTNGDNDTYPLWYAQNVEGIRRDIRVMNMQLLNTDWYSNSLRRKVYESEGFKFTSKPDQLAEGNRDFIRFYANNNLGIDQNKYYPIQEILSFVFNDDNPRAKIQLQNGEYINYLPTKKVVVNVDKEKALKNGIFFPEDSAFVNSEILIDLNKDLLLKADLVVLDIIANNINERPIYFTSTTGNDTYLNLQEYFQMDGLVFRLVPIKRPQAPYYNRVNPDRLYEKLVNQFQYGGINNDQLLLDEQVFRLVRNLRNLYGILGVNLMNQNQKDKAIKTIDRCIAEFPAHRIPYGEFNSVSPLIQVYHYAGAQDKANALMRTALKEFGEDYLYYRTFYKARKADEVGYEITQSGSYLNSLLQLAQSQGQKEIVDEINKVLAQ